MFILYVLLVLACALGMGAKTYALVIGVGEFNDPKIQALPGALEDARQLAVLFERLGIASPGDGSLELLLNPTGNELYGAIFNWTTKGEEGDRMVLYYGGHGETLEENGKARTYLVPSDGFSEPRLLRRSCVDFQEEIMPLFEENLEGKETLLIIDACYSGSILGTRPLSAPKIEYNEFGVLAQARGIQVLVSAGGDELSREKPGGGGYFTTALIEGMKGAANANGNETIEMGELGAYVQREVKASTENKQNPRYFGNNPEMVIAQDPAKTTNELKRMVMDLFSDGNISLDHFAEYGKILGQEAMQDTPVQQKIRKYLEQYYQVRDVETLNTMTQKALGEETSV
ncbi:MAG TPA: caspase family protein, partial [Thermotogota bacterium]|nr:caspase family protein [Thermotogota bacterium]